MVKCPKCNSYGSYGRRAVILINGEFCVSYNCRRCGFEKEVKYSKEVYRKHFERG